jgi:hypothetical protein
VNESFIKYRYDHLLFTFLFVFVSCWGSIAGGYRTLVGEGKELRQQKESCTGSDANSCLNFFPPHEGVPVQVYFIGEVKGLITMP